MKPRPERPAEQSSHNLVMVIPEDHLQAPAVHATGLSFIEICERLANEFRLCVRPGFFENINGELFEHFLWQAAAIAVIQSGSFVLITRCR